MDSNTLLVTIITLCFFIAFLTNPDGSINKFTVGYVVGQLVAYFLLGWRPISNKSNKKGDN